MTMKREGIKKREGRGEKRKEGELKEWRESVGQARSFEANRRKGTQMDPTKSKVKVI